MSEENYNKIKRTNSVTEQLVDNFLKGCYLFVGMDIVHESSPLLRYRSNSSIGNDSERRPSSSYTSPSPSPSPSPKAQETQLEDPADLIAQMGGALVDVKRSSSSLNDEPIAPYLYEQQRQQFISHINRLANIVYMLIKNKKGEVFSGTPALKLGRARSDLEQNFTIGNVSFDVGIASLGPLLRDILGICSDLTRSEQHIQQTKQDLEIRLDKYLAGFYHKKTSTQDLLYLRDNIKFDISKLKECLAQEISRSDSLEDDRAVSPSFDFHGFFPDDEPGKQSQQQSQIEKLEAFFNNRSAALEGENDLNTDIEQLNSLLERTSSIDISESDDKRQSIMSLQNIMPMICFKLRDGEDHKKLEKLINGQIAEYELKDIKQLQSKCVILLSDKWTLYEIKGVDESQHRSTLQPLNLSDQINKLQDLEKSFNNDAEISVSLTLLKFDHGNILDTTRKFLEESILFDDAKVCCEKISNLTKLLNSKPELKCEIPEKAVHDMYKCVYKRESDNIDCIQQSQHTNYLKGPGFLFSTTVNSITEHILGLQKSVKGYYECGDDYQQDLIRRHSFQ